MAENKVQDYFDKGDEGHIDTREANFKCENPDPNLGCNLGIDVAGEPKERCAMIGTMITLITIGYFINSCIAERSAGAACKI